MSDTLFDLVVPLGVPGYIVLQIVVPRLLRGGWRRAALAPLFIAVPLAVFCFFAFIMQSNLWPLTIILFAPLGTIYLLVAWIAGWVFRATS